MPRLLCCPDVAATNPSGALPKRNSFDRFGRSTGGAVSLLSMRMLPRNSCPADAVASHEPLREWPVITAAMRVDGENLRSGAHQQDIPIATWPSKVSPVK